MIYALFVFVLILIALYILFLHRRYGRMLEEKSGTIDTLLTLLGGVVRAETEVVETLTAAGDPDRK